MLRPWTSEYLFLHFHPFVFDIISLFALCRVAHWPHLVSRRMSRREILLLSFLIETNHGYGPSASRLRSYSWSLEMPRELPVHFILFSPSRIDRMTALLLLNSGAWPGSLAFWIPPTTSSLLSSLLSSLECQKGGCFLLSPNSNNYKVDWVCP